MAKKLFLMTILVLGINIQLCASESQPDPDKELLNFANYLDRVPTESSEPRTIATWIREIFYGSDKSKTDQLKDIVTSTKDDAQRAKAIKQIYIKETTPQQQDNTSYFSNISTRVKAAAALVITVGIASYLYFMRPWSTPTAE